MSRHGRDPLRFLGVGGLSRLLWCHCECNRKCHHWPSVPSHPTQRDATPLKAYSPLPSRRSCVSCGVWSSPDFGSSWSRKLLSWQRDRGLNPHPLRQTNPHYSRMLLLQPPIRRCDKPDGGWARHSVGQHTVSSMPPSLTSPRARLAWRLNGFVTNPRE